ncbi:MAG: two pore domain potassium channel family protein [Rhizobiales bacterium]|nr:two pore domain potassium channel family protein [Hyphomicrobiales bacterium]
MDEVGTGLLIKQLFIGSLVIAATVAVHAEMLAVLTQHSPKLMQLSRAHLRRFSETGFITAGVLYILLAHTVEVWIWAIVLMATGAVIGLEPAVYFSLVSFTTLGFGDITLSTEWRLMSALIGANGFLLFGWSTAYMVELVRRTS